MKFAKLLFVTVAFAILVAACGNTANNSTTSTTNTAKNTAPAHPRPRRCRPRMNSPPPKIFSEKCVGCHKENGTGGEKDVDGVKIKVPDLTSEKMKNEPDNDFIDIINNGDKEEGMPAFKGKISEQEIKDLVKLIRKEIQKK
ncbi:MAG: cytochrome c [Acidobacteria bacterium]|nr:cytochrome c [Acidobacteriota bacterium]